MIIPFRWAIDNRFLWIEPQGIQNVTECLIWLSGPLWAPLNHPRPTDNSPFPWVSSQFGEWVTPSTQVVFFCVYNQRSANHVPYLQHVHQRVNQKNKQTPPQKTRVWACVHVTLSSVSSSLNEALPSGPAMMFPRSPTCWNSDAMWDEN